MSFEEFQDGRHGHLGYRNETILAILNLCAIVMPLIKFWLNPTHGLAASLDIVPWWSSWLSDQIVFGN